MKALLGCLLCLVLGGAQAFAISGGPQFGGSRIRTTGVFSGVLVPGPLSPGSNSTGLFSLTIPKSGLGTGFVVIFATGEAYVGTIQGSADPDSAKLTAQISASFSYQAQVLTGHEVTTDPSGKVTTKDTYGYQTFAATAEGKVDARIVQNKNPLSTASTRIRGEANVQFSLTILNPFTQIDYTVSGYKQSEVTG